MVQSITINPRLIKELQDAPDKFYKKFLRPKMKHGSPQIDFSNNSCKLRLVTKPIYSIKVIQKAVKTYLDEFDLPDCMHGGIIGICNFDNVLPHINNRFFLTIDLRNFFGTINNTRVHQTLVSLGHSWSVARHITRIATLDGCLPQGSPTSTTLANLVFAPTALLLEDFCKARNITFTAYIDDLTFSSPVDFNQYKTQILELLKTGKFPVNQNKVHYRVNNCEITGIIVDKGQLSLPRKIINNAHKPGVKTYITHFTNRYQEYLQNKKAALLS